MRFSSPNYSAVVTRRARSVALRTTTLLLTLASVATASITLAATASTATPAATSAEPVPYIQRPDVQAFMADVVKKDGLKPEEVKRLIAGAKPQQSIIDSISKPAEHTLTWADYRRIFITEDRITRGITFYNTYKAQLKRAERQYGVPAEMIVAIIGVETRFGQNKGNYRVIDALSTLGFDYPPRAEFFRQQLRAYLILGNEAGIDLATATGSYAGAMGYPQFMPSSYRDFAVDFDADNKIDLINNPVDAIGSVANYFKKHGWHTGEGIVKRATYTGQPDKVAQLDKILNLSFKPTVKASEPQRLGLRTKVALPPSLLVSPMSLQGAKGTQYWLGLNNFYVITRYNNSNLYALAAFQLSQKIKDKI